MRTFGWALIVLACGGAAAGPARGGAAYDEIRGDVAVAADLAGGRFQELWHLSPLIALSAETPSTVGRIGLALFGARARAREAALPDLWIGGLRAMWMPELTLSGRLRLGAGAAFGLQVARAGAEGSAGRAQTESEYAVDLCLRARGVVAEHLDVHAGVRRRTLLTNDPIRQTLVAVGLGVTFETPRWLRDILR